MGVILKTRQSTQRRSHNVFSAIIHARGETSDVARNKTIQTVTYPWHPPRHDENVWHNRRTRLAHRAILTCAPGLPLPKRRAGYRATDEYAGSRADCECAGALRYDPKVCSENRLHHNAGPDASFPR